MNDLLIREDQYCQVKSRFEELTILNKYVHKPEQVPGVVVAAYGEQIKSHFSEERREYRLGLGDSGSPFTSIQHFIHCRDTTLSNVLETSFEILEGIQISAPLRRDLLKHLSLSSSSLFYLVLSRHADLPVQRHHNSNPPALFAGLQHNSSLILIIVVNAFGVIK